MRRKHEEEEEEKLVAVQLISRETGCLKGKKVGWTNFTNMCRCSEILKIDSLLKKKFSFFFYHPVCFFPGREKPNCLGHNLSW